MRAPPDGTRAILPDEAARRADLLARLRRLYEGWGYELVEVPALERYDDGHPRADQSFKLSDRDSGVLALRADFTPALARLVRQSYPARHVRAEAGPADALRLQYRGTLWHAIDPELARTREFTQVGLELIGVSNARADAELIHLARESVRLAGLDPRVEVGNPGFVRALLEGAAVRDALERVPDLYGPSRDADAIVAEALELADAAALPAARREIVRLQEVLEQFEDDSELLLDLGMARRLSYYTGVTFRAYTLDYGQPLLGGGRYDGALLPHAAGFAIGLERLLAAAPATAAWHPPRVLSLDDVGARRLRAAGIGVARALGDTPDAARREARARGVPLLLLPPGADPRIVVLDDGAGDAGGSAPDRRGGARAVDAAELARVRGLVEADDTGAASSSSRSDAAADGAAGEADDA